MSLLSKTSLRRAALALCAFATASLVFATPALADHGRHRRHHRGHHGHHGRHFPFPAPHIVFGLPAPPVIVIGPRRVHDRYDRYDRRERAYDRGYEDGYDDGYDDRAREDRRHRHDRDCDHDYYY